MNRYLLDTHILLWWLSDDKKLDQKKRAIISKASNHIIVSAVSIWEIIIKKSLKKLNAPDDLKNILHKNNFEIMDITVDHVLTLEELPLIHNDPFDRLLLAQSIYEDLVLITVDENILRYKLN